MPIRLIIIIINLLDLTLIRWSLNPQMEPFIHPCTSDNALRAVVVGIKLCISVCFAGALVIHDHFNDDGGGCQKAFVIMSCIVLQHCISVHMQAKGYCA